MERHSQCAVSADLPGVAVVRVHGDLDMNSAPQLREHLHATQAAGVPVLIVDVSAVSFCDSVGMSELVLALHRSKSDGTRLMLSGVHGSLEKLLYRTGLHNLFENHLTCEQALRAAG